MARKFPNFYVDTSAYAVHRLPPELVDFMRGPGRTRVLFGTNWPMLSPSQSWRASTGSASTTKRATFSWRATRGAFSDWRP